jgi:hypothetical protein
MIHRNFHMMSDSLSLVMYSNILLYVMISSALSLCTDTLNLILTGLSSSDDSWSSFKCTIWPLPFVHLVVPQSGVIVQLDLAG